MDIVSQWWCKHQINKLDHSDDGAAIDQTTNDQASMAGGSGRGAKVLSSKRWWFKQAHRDRDNDEAKMILHHHDEAKCSCSDIKRVGDLALQHSQSVSQSASQWVLGGRLCERAFR